MKENFGQIVNSHLSSIPLGIEDSCPVTPDGGVFFRQTPDILETVDTAGCLIDEDNRQHWSDNKSYGGVEVKLELNSTSTISQKLQAIQI